MNTPTTTTPKTSEGDPGPMPDFLKRQEPPKQQEPAKQPFREYKFHPIADIFPLMSGEEFALLVDDIETNGLREPIWLYEGKILDGRNRYNACKELDLHIETIKDIKYYSGNDPLGFVFSANFYRRHLNESQRASVAARILTTKLGDNQHIEREGRPIDQPTAAEMLNVSVKSIGRAKDVLEKSAPELQALVDDGKVAVSVAQKLANKLPKDKQAELAESGDAAVRSAAKELGKGSRPQKNGRTTTKDLKKQVDDFKAEWPNLNEWQKRYFVKTYLDELGKLVEEIKSLAGMVEEEEQEQEQEQVA